MKTELQNNGNRSWRATPARTAASCSPCVPPESIAGRRVPAAGRAAIGGVLRRSRQAERAGLSRLPALQADADFRAGAICARARARCWTTPRESSRSRSLASRVGLSPFHLQRLFKRATGLSPREYQAARRMQQVKTGLRKGEDVTTALYEAGFGSPSRLYERPPSNSA